MWGGRFADFISFFLKYPMKMNKFGLSETKLFHFYVIKKKTRGREEGVRANLLNPLWIRNWASMNAMKQSHIG